MHVDFIIVLFIEISITIDEKLDRLKISEKFLKEISVSLSKTPIEGVKNFYKNHLSLFSSIDLFLQDTEKRFDLIGVSLVSVFWNKDFRDEDGFSK